VTNFNLPTAPDTTFPDAHVWADRVIWAVAIAFFAYCLRDWRRTGSPLGVVLMLGGALAYFNESVDDVLGLVHHPRPGQNVVLDTIGPVPMWGLPTYIIFFGAIAFVFLRELQRRGLTLRAFWIGIAITFVVDLALEMPLLWADGGLYQYYGDTPMTVARFPVYWLLINTPGPILCATILYTVPGYFRGWRAPLVVLVPFVADAACSIVVGLPIYTALHAPAAGGAVTWGAALLSCAIGLLLLDAFARLILWRRRALSAGALHDRDLALAAVDTQRVAVANR
jgi:hypothetical protein